MVIAVGRDVLAGMLRAHGEDELQPVRPGLLRAPVWGLVAQSIATRVYR
jgi:hypothetical protein